MFFETEKEAQKWWAALLGEHTRLQRSATREALHAAHWLSVAARQHELFFEGVGAFSQARGGGVDLCAAPL